MDARITNRQRSFVWQALLILLPLFVLTVLCVIFLQQDRKLARATATEQCQILAESLSRNLWFNIQRAANETTLKFEVTPSGTLLRPAPVQSPDILPAPDSGEDSSRAAELFEQGIGFARSGDSLKAAETFHEVAIKFPQAKGGTGLPLEPLVRYRLFELQARSKGDPMGVAAAESFCSNVVSNPTFITPLLLEKAAQAAIEREIVETIQKWKLRWAQHDYARAAFDRAQQRFANVGGAPFLAWLDPELLLVRTSPGQSNQTFALLHKSILLDACQSASRLSGRTPPYATVNLEVAGARLDPAAAAPSGQAAETIIQTRKPEILAEAQREEERVDVLKVTLALSNSEALFRDQRARTYWLAGLLVASLGMASVGLGTAWRSFRQQERLNTLKSNFVSSVSHELRAPIASLRLMAENLETGKVPEEPRRLEYFKFIGQECRRLSALIENVLDFSRIDQGRKVYEFESCDLERILAATAQLMAPVAQQHGVKVSLEQTIAPATGTNGLPWLVDGKALQQALINIVDNAIKHSPAGTTVSMGLEKGMDQVSLWVEDHGSGIPASEHTRIFERFYRLGSELRRETQGVGIGLSIVKHIVEAHKGRVQVRSAPGEGSRFTIVLPNHNSGTVPASQE